MRPVICIPYYESNPVDIYRNKAYQKTKEYYSKLNFPIFSGDTSINYSNRAKSRNQAVKMIDCDYNMILFFDADIIVPLDQVQAAINLAYRTNEMVLMFDFLYLLTEKVTNNFYKDNIIQNKMGIYRKNPSSGAFAVPRNIWEKVGGQDERFKKWGGEDRAFYFSCAAVHNKRVIQRIPGKAWHLFHKAKKHTLHDLRNNLLLQKYLRAVKACPRFTVPNETLEDNSKIFSILKEKDGPLYVEPKEIISSKNNTKFQNMVTFVSTTGYRECVEKGSSTYKILKRDPSFKEICPTSSDSLCVVNQIKLRDRFVFNATQKWINKHFSSLYSPKDYVVVLGSNIGDSFFEFKRKNPNKKIIVYQLEQLFNYLSQWYNPKSKSALIQRRTKHIKQWLDNADEIWDYDLDNASFLRSLGYKVKHVPLSVDKDLGYNLNLPTKEYDLVFYGALNDKRYHWLKKFDEKYKMLFIGNIDRYKFKNSIEPVFGEKLFNNVLKAKIAINLHYYDSGLQEQIRIFELLSNNMIVISEKSRRNYLNVPEFETFAEACQLIDFYLKKEEIKMTEKKTIKVGAIYNSFYGLEFIERSIISIRKEVDYIALIHQNKSINKKTQEPPGNKKIIEELLHRNLIDEVVYVNNDNNLTPENFILHKRNTGLNLCRKNNCDYIIPLDTDEVYNGYELLKEIHYMWENNIDTLYSPIISYYYNEFYSFKDDYYVSSAYKINNRNFSKSRSSVLVDPVRKMKEGKYKISDVVMHHYTYLYQYYKIKMVEAISAQLRSSVKSSKLQLFDEMQNFDGVHGHVFCNDKKRGIHLKKIILNKKT